MSGLTVRIQERATDETALLCVAVFASRFAGRQQPLDTSSPGELECLLREVVTAPSDHAVQTGGRTLAEVAGGGVSATWGATALGRDMRVLRDAEAEKDESFLLPVLTK